MESPPSSPTSLVVSSPRRTLSLLRERRAGTSTFEAVENKRAAAAGFAEEHGPKPSEVYGFVGSISTVIATGTAFFFLLPLQLFEEMSLISFLFGYLFDSGIYLMWAYIPEPWLHSLGITYYPSKYWALAVPTFAMVAVVLVIAFYIGLNFMITPHPTSFNTIVDEYSREPSKEVRAEGEEPIEPISDVHIYHVNDLMFGQTSIQVSLRT
ncbi:Phosphatidylinositol N-acetylglucosaminyltransferase subunit P [Apostasia shenzhenica]|uniref:Phosphatidylinositol N-acetylglucosaminyltransferase subunit P n=1 Tax=Apostasia shenzhenica TaxID=1088818 RepID=A0A2I0ATM5_9ASPA|nr:Phosphatidylinositol N-acetylglucosaminyltransferase subunit P [Apostasia shenzhenica]